MEFREAKTVIRAALEKADGDMLAGVLVAARAGEMPYGSQCYRCLSEHLYGFWRQEGIESSLSVAYRVLGSESLPLNSDASLDEFMRLLREAETRRQSVIVAMILAEIRRRGRMALVAGAVVVEEPVVLKC